MPGCQGTRTETIRTRDSQLKRLSYRENCCFQELSSRSLLSLFGGFLVDVDLDYRGNSGLAVSGQFFNGLDYRIVL